MYLKKLSEILRKNEEDERLKRKKIKGKERGGKKL